MKRSFFKYLGALLLPGVMSAGTISIGTSDSVVSFDPSTSVVALGACAIDTVGVDVCKISGGGSVSEVPFVWEINTNLSLGVVHEITTSGSVSPFTINMNGTGIGFGLTDSPLSDVIFGLLSLTNAANGSNAQIGDFTDIRGILTFTTSSLVTPELITFFQDNYGSVPTVSSQAQLDLIVSCGATTVCISSADPSGSIVSATITSQSAVPEPGTLSLLGGGFAALICKRRRRKNRSSRVSSPALIARG